MTNKNTFISITNQDIYDKLIEIEKHVKETNGKVKVNYWIGRTALLLAVSAITATTTIAVRLFFI